VLSNDTSAQTTAEHTPSLPRVVRIAANVVIIGLWLWLYRPVFDYLAIIFSREDFRTNQLVLVGVILLIVLQARKGRLRPQLDAAPQVYLPALVLALGGSALYLVIERFLDINTLSASLFGLASYGLLGLWMRPRSWRQGLPAALLLIGALPFGEHLQTFVGYPMRIFTAAIVRDGLASAGVASIGIDTILVLENGVSQIDLPCSGVKSLWTGMLFLIAATWVERRPLNWRWFIVAFIFGGLLFIANVIRVGILVIVGQAAGWRLAAEMLHIPLGVLGFVAACAAAVLLLRLQQFPPGPLEGVLLTPNRPLWLSPALGAIMLLMAIAYTPRPQTGLTQSPPIWTFPDPLVTEPMPLKPDEIEWLTREGAESAVRLRFEWRAPQTGDAITGSMILITSATWRAHHRPERCFEVYGLSIDGSRPYLVNSDFPLRLVTLGDGDGHGLRSAAYWFQSDDRTTDDYATRIWADLNPKRERWVLVSILFDDVYDPNAADTQMFFSALHDAMRRNLEGSRYEAQQLRHQ